MKPVLAASLALLSPALALAQQTSNSSPITPPTSFGGGIWVLAFALIAVIAAVFFGFRAMTERRRNPPHGPQAPTPRGP